LVRKGKCGNEDVFVNGDFSETKKVLHDPQNFCGKVEGWRFVQLELSTGPRYNKLWPKDVRVAHLTPKV
jgi:hypothetical protein